MVIVAGLLFLTYLFYRDWKRILSLPEILRGFIPFFWALYYLQESDFSWLEITTDCLPTIP
jgi:hypothetical protein